MAQLLVFAAPAGGGKTTVIRAVRASHPEWSFSCSATTRPPRPGEVHGQDYYFFSREEFERRIAAGEFLEHEEVHGNLYGTLKIVVDDALAAGRTMILDLDVKGAASIKRFYPDALTIFIRPPSLEVLKERLIKRGTDAPEVVAKRLSRAEMELAQANLFDCVIVNNEIEQAVADVLTCIEKDSRAAE
ncbi:MAG: guanylate kinase [bacterium]|nr:guanylate kinase [bacterium]